MGTVAGLKDERLPAACCLVDLALVVGECRLHVLAIGHDVVEGITENRLDFAPISHIGTWLGDGERLTHHSVAKSRG
jgi:hypothetical protein